MLKQFAYDRKETKRGKRLAARPVATPRRKKWSKSTNLWDLLDDDALTLILAHCEEKACVRLSGLDRRTNGMAKRALKQRLGLGESQWQTFRAVVERRESVFISGAPGTGKSHLLRVIRERIPRHSVWTASTGAAAEKLEARTVHSTFCISGGDRLEAKHTASSCRRLRPDLRTMRTLVIDEVSMLSGYFLTFLLRVIEDLLLHPGAVQFVLCGDPLQLGAPHSEVVKMPPGYEGYRPNGSRSPFWTSDIYEKVRPYVLTENFRQGDDSQFASILNRARIGKASPADLDWLLANARQSQLYGPLGASRENQVRGAWKNNSSGHTPRPMCLFCRREPVRDFNDHCVASLSGLGRVYYGMRSNGATDHSAPGLALSTGARVMLTRNLREQPKLFNGSMGTVDKLQDSWVRVRFDNGIHTCIKRVRIAIGKWESDGGGDVFRIPLELAYAATVHKAQGATLDSACVDVSGAFTEGQTYVALSRVRKIGDMEILGLDLPKLNRVDRVALQFYTRIKEQSEEHMRALTEGELARGIL